LWYQTGQLCSEGHFENNLPEGHWTFWMINGQKEAEGTLRQGIREGQWTFWHQTGQMERVGTYTSGIPSGLHQLWNFFGVASEETEADREQKIKEASHRHLKLFKGQSNLNVSAANPAFPVDLQHGSPNVHADPTVLVCEHHPDEFR